MDAFLSIRGVRVVYPGGIIANDNVSLDVRRGEILALLGENGAGKTTLIKVIAGLVKPASGELVLDGVRFKPSSYRDALRNGVYMVPQMPQFFDGLTVFEDILLTLRIAGRGISGRDLRRKVDELAGRLGFRVDLDSYCWSLSMGEKQRVELLKALLLDSKLLMLDEPTTHMTLHEFRLLREMLRGLASEGRSIIFVTHKVREALDVADRIAVMRKGRVVGVFKGEEVDEDILIKHMFGESNGLAGPAPETYKSSQLLAGKPILEVIDLWVRGAYGQIAVKGVSMVVGRGEIVGVAGLAGNGQRELFEAIIGLRKPARGRIILDGEDVTDRSPAHRVRKGLAVIPEERLGWGLAPGLSVVENAVFSLLPVNSTIGGFMVDWRKARGVAEEVVAMTKVKIPSLDASVDSLSGGNMQKLMVARELYKKPTLIIAMNPTGGLDLQTARLVRGMIVASSRGSGALIISEDLEELLEVSDRIYVMSNGVVRGVFEKPFNVDTIARAMAG
jgi:simple sugar transport system ATP-binding protein